tara:strand:- start:1974 stop:2612 length:639 start_codon:yes stop_codon:yes gene_type:complete
MTIEQINGFWVPSHDAQIGDWRETGAPFVQDKCLNYFTKYCLEKKIMLENVLDIGAWCGTWSATMQKFAKKINCFEPNKVHFECLQKNLEGHQHIKTFNHAVGSENGYVKLSEESATQNTRVIQEKGDIPIFTVDSLKFENVDMIKIDVEGLEMEVLKGATNTLENVKYLMIELNNNSKKYGSSNREIEKYLHGLGFRVLIKVWPDIVYRKK